MIAIHSRPATVDQNVLWSRVLWMPSSLASVKEYDPAIWARFAITMMSAMMMPQPPIHPTMGPNARVAQVKVVPQSGSASFSSL